MLHIDSNDYYGGLWASFNLENIESLVKNVSKLSIDDQINDGIVRIDDTNKCLIENAEFVWHTKLDADVNVENEASAADEAEKEEIVSVEAEAEPPAETIWTKEKVLREFRKFNIDLTPKV